jgi:Zn-dependent protease with chaperone function
MPEEKPVGRPEGGIPVGIISASPNANAARFVPQNRESFFDAQRRNRRATWRMSSLCVLSALVMGIPVALIITPLLYGLGLIVADIVNYFSPLPPAFWQFASDFAAFGLVAVGWLLQQKPADPQVLSVGLGVMFLPGVLLSFVLWLGIKLLFQRSGVGGALLALKAREPNPADLKELQLSDVVQEMAIASGLPAPTVMLVDAPGANAAAIGTSPRDARIVVSRRLIDDLSRDELEAVLAYLISSVGNGDLHIAFRMTAVLETCGLIVTFINSPFGPQSRRVLWRILRYAVRGSIGKHDPQEAGAIAELLSRGSNLETDDIDNFFDSGRRKSKLRSIRNFLFFPIFFTNAAIKMSLWFFSMAALGPAMALLWRTRCYLADASAVQLTRNPDSLASALQKLSHEPGEIPGGDWAAHLFFVNPKSGNREAPDARQRKILAQAWKATEKAQTGPSASSGITEFYQLQPELASTVRAAMAGDALAAERLRATYRSIQASDPALAAQIPNPDDLLAARHGDMAALARMMAVRKSHELRQDSPQATTSRRTEESSSSGSFMSFHPSIERRLKRLARMGAHFEATKSKTGIVVFVLALILTPLMLLAIALFLLLISIMTMASLVFLVIWLAVIHKLFALLPHAVAG